MNRRKELRKRNRPVSGEVEADTPCPYCGHLERGVLGMRPQGPLACCSLCAQRSREWREKHDGRMQQRKPGV